MRAWITCVAVVLVTLTAELNVIAPQAQAITLTGSSAAPRLVAALRSRSIDCVTDIYVPRSQAERFKAARPRTDIVVLEPGDLTDPSTSFVHGTASAGGRAVYASAVGGFADRIEAAHAAQRRAVRTRCANVKRPLAAIRSSTIKAALICQEQGQDAGAAI